MKIISNSMFLFLIGFIACSPTKNSDQRSDTTKNWPVASYNYGGLEKKTPQEQLQLLENSGYDGIVLKSEKIEDFNSLEEFIRLDEMNSKFKINAVFERYNFNDSEERKERWKKVVDKIANRNIQIWIIFGKKTEGITDDFIDQKLREITNYAKQKKVEVILYPHSDCYIASAEEALPFVEKINNSNLKLAIHLYHEVRAGNGARIAEVFDKVKHRLGAVTFAGTNVVADYTNPKTRDLSTIKPVGTGDFDLTHFILPLKKSNYKGTVTIMNFGITESPEVYLPKSLAEWNRLVKN
ncbi:sugar phosphate isomerase/epimerase family protein [Flavobacterium nackdongense]|uniref:Sugar phosphate isomerase/epimerase n=1 Tax=Flavobacterium nackdongense TaxID=2547394 RepID=A0A4P6YB60_9FLAO|nr:TIM barrel protein [Flavobacterium nackdongense]QBN17895.1 sugar phosphate isomerase/epimerase [Flavobacterium nackdongense]